MRNVYESDIESKACEEAKKLGVRNLKILKGSETGWPDRIFFIPGGRPLFIEFKRPGEPPSPKQEYIHGILQRLGYDIEVHDTVEGAIRSIASALERSLKASSHIRPVKRIDKGARQIPPRFGNQK